MNKSTRWYGLAIALLAGVFAWPAKADKVYWVQAGYPILRANLDGTDREEVVTTHTGGPLYVAVDVDGGKIYWTWQSKVPAGGASRANLDGTGIEDLLATLENPGGIALDLQRGKMYLGSRDGIVRANLDGSETEVFDVGSPYPRGVAFDVDAGKIYWTAGTQPWPDPAGFVRRANLDGTDIEDLVVSENTQLEGIALDLRHGRVYWAEGDAYKIRRANLDGTDVEDIIPEARWPVGLALDLPRGKIYWTNHTTIGGILRANLDGTAVEEPIPGLDFPIGIALQLDCGNGVIDTGELCDIAIPTGSPGACPTVCSDGDACTGDALVGAGSCQDQCEFTPITDPIDGDGCCPEGATPMTDSDCAAIPTVSGWGVAIMTLVLLAGARIWWRQRRSRPVENPS